MQPPRERHLAVWVLTLLAVPVLACGAWLIFILTVSSYATGGLPGGGNVTVRSNSMYLAISGGGTKPTRIETRGREIRIDRKSISIDGTQVGTYDNGQRVYVEVGRRGVTVWNDGRTIVADYHETGWRPE